MNFSVKMLAVAIGLYSHSLLAHDNIIQINANDTCGEIESHFNNATNGSVLFFSSGEYSCGFMKNYIIDKNITITGKKGETVINGG